MLQIRKQVQSKRSRRTFAFYPEIQDSQLPVHRSKNSATFGKDRRKTTKQT
jgi:hypothetical protein